MIRIEHMTFGYHFRSNLFEDYSLEIPNGARICFFSRSGGGKSTLFRLILGLETPRRGRITGTELLAKSVVFQEDRLIPHMTALGNVSLFADSSSASRILTALGLHDYMDACPDELSGGMKRRVALARAIAHPFDLLILDEAFTGLDPETRAICLSAVRDALAPESILLMATHDLSEAEELGATIIKWDTETP